MYLKSALVALSALLFSGFAAGADDAASICGMSIEGATLLMSKDEVAAAWTGTGLNQIVRKSKRPVIQQSLRFLSEDQKPGEAFITQLLWAEARPGKIGNSISATYGAPDDAARMPAYDRLQRSIVANFCTKALPALRAMKAAEVSTGRVNPRMPKRRDERLPGFCERAVTGDFAMNEHGIIAIPNQQLVQATEAGCSLLVKNTPAGETGKAAKWGKGGLFVSIIGPGVTE